MFSQTTEYALRAMVWLALSPDTLVSTGSLAEHTRVPEHYLAKVLQQLSSARLIKGRRGVGGGYMLARPAEQIAVSEIVRTVGSLSRIESCPLGIPSHGSNLCPLHRLLDEVAAAALAILDGRTLKDLVDRPGANTPLCEDRRAPVAPTVGGRPRG
jgi:Rrf2 family protein